MLRRSQILLLSDQKQPVREIAAVLGCSRQGVRNVLHRFNHRGMVVLERGSHRPQSGASAQPALDEAKRQQLAVLLEQSPRLWGKSSSLWTVALVAEVAYEQGLTSQQLGRESVRIALRRLGLNWKRAKQWIASPDPGYTRKKTDATA